MDKRFWLGLVMFLIVLFLSTVNDAHAQACYGAQCSPPVANCDQCNVGGLPGAPTPLSTCKFSTGCSPTLCDFEDIKCQFKRKSPYGPRPNDYDACGPLTNEVFNAYSTSDPTWTGLMTGACYPNACGPAEYGPCVRELIQPQGGGGPTPTPGGGECSPSCGQFIQLPPLRCDRVPCSCNAPNCTNCTGPFDESCGGGGGGPPSPTPTPSPYCTLSCFNLSGRQGGADMGGSRGGVSGGSQSEPAPTVMPPLITGTINYSGYNSFNCGTFKDGMWYSGPCPTPQGGGGGLGFGQSSSWSHYTKYNMLCGGNPHTYTAQIEAGSAGSGDLGQGGPTATPQPTTTSLYPQGCSVGVPTPTRGTDQGVGIGGSRGGVSSSSACSCSVTLSCQDRLYDSPNSSACTPTCNFSVNPEYPLFNQATTFAITQNTPSSNITFSFDDGSANVANQSTVNHTFVNAGVYDVALACTDTSETCTRRVNTYCDNGVVPPSPTPTPGPWFKVKNSDFVKTGTLNNALPDPVTAFDSDDTGDPDCSGQAGGGDIRCFNLNQSGVAIASQAVDTGTAPISSREWRIENYSSSRRLDPTAFLQYTKARKRYKTIISLSEIEKNTVNVISGSQTITSGVLPDQDPYVLVVQGDLTIDVAGSFDPGGSVAFVVTGQLALAETVTELKGIYIANTFDSAKDVETTTNTLKMKGNLVITEDTTTLSKRSRTDTDKPSVFIVSDSKQYVDLLPLLSVRQYVWEELAP